MISLEEIRKKATSWWPDVLVARVEGTSFFPKAITRIGRIQGGDILRDYTAIQEGLSRLNQFAKPQVANSYVVRLEAVHFRNAGDHLLPEFIEFETLADYLTFTGKENEWLAFNRHLELILTTIPVLKEWVLLNVLRLTDSTVSWVNILQVCRYFIQHPRPNLYIRQLPIEVHTKFMEQNAPLLCSLLDFLIPSGIRNPRERRMDKRYYLRYDEPLIRMSILDRMLSIVNIACLESDTQSMLTDISIPLSDFEGLRLPVENVLIAENKMNFLTLPSLPGTIAVWSGGGFQVSCLQDARWLGLHNIYYWGDMDEHGFQILHQLRTYFPGTKSIMMDVETLTAFNEHRGIGAKSRAEFLSLLTPEEQLCYQQIKNSSLNRLEQEKIDQQYVEDYLRRRVICSGNIA